MGPNFQTAFAPAVVSFDVVWRGTSTRSLSVTDSTHLDLFTGSFVENQATVTWSGTNLATGFSFIANPGDFSTSAPGRAFAELGHEQNGIFFSPDSSTDDAIAQSVIQKLSVQPPPKGVAATPLTSVALPVAGPVAVVAPVSQRIAPTISTDPGGSDVRTESSDLGGALFSR